MERILGSSSGLVAGIAAAVGYAFFALVVITVDRFRAGSASKDDTQVELKVLLHALALIGLFLAADGGAGLLAAILGGFPGGAAVVKGMLAPIVVGVGAFAGVMLALLPRTNAKAARGAEALALLTVGLYFGISAIASAHLFVTGVVMSSPWAVSSAALAQLLVDGAIGFIGLGRLGALAGWTQPVRPAPPPPPPYPPQGGGYPPPQGGGYPLPQGGGYPPPGGGYPPPQGGGYPPQGGGFPPPQGGGYPPAGGGYPPR